MTITTITHSSPYKACRWSIRCLHDTGIHYEYFSVIKFSYGVRVHSPAVRCHPRSRPKDAAPLEFSAREENFATEEEGNVRLAAARSDASTSVRSVRELFTRVIWYPLEWRGSTHPTIRSFGNRSVRFRFLCRVFGGACLGTEGPDIEDD